MALEIQAPAFCKPAMALEIMALAQYIIIPALYKQALSYAEPAQSPEIQALARYKEAMALDA